MVLRRVPQKTSIRGASHYVRDSMISDVDAMADVLIHGEGYTHFFRDMSDIKRKESTVRSLTAFLEGPKKHGLMVTDAEGTTNDGFILFHYRNRLTETFEDYSIIDELDPELFPPNGDFCEVFDLWVSPSRRRQGLARFLKLAMERHALGRGVRMIYTHTEQTSPHIIDLNQQLGYEIVRTGTIWDEVVRVSLVKYLDVGPSL